MINRIPIYQMSYGQSKNGDEGLLFSSEIETDSQSVLYTIPLIEPFDHPLDFFHYFEYQTYYFPFFFNNEYLELEGHFDFPEISFAVPNTDYKIIFELDATNIPTWHIFFRKQMRFRKLKYVGSYDKIIVPNSGFISLLPIDLYEMDNLFLEHRGIFVGFTPNIQERFNNE